MSRTAKIVTSLVAIALLAIGIFAWLLSTSIGTMSINGTELTVRIAEHSLAQKKGLSGYTEESLQEDGMLFIFSDAEVRTFWMKDMQFDLDILWIADGRVVAIDRHVRAPFSRADEPERVTSLPLKVDAVLELPAGKVEEYGFLEGMTAVISE